MGKQKRQTREAFRRAVFERDQYTCRVCGRRWGPGDADPSLRRINAHHITDRTEMPGGGYVPENGITLCEDPCHMRVELFHYSKGYRWHEGLHPDDLYSKIGSSHEAALRASRSLLDF